MARPFFFVGEGEVDYRVDVLDGGARFAGQTDP